MERDYHHEHAKELNALSPIAVSTNQCYNTSIVIYDNRITL